MRNQDGFTLVEVLVVILILGTLMAMAVPNFRNARELGRIAAMKMNVHNVQVVVETFHQDQGYYADDFYEDGYGGYFPGGVFDVELGRLPSNPWTGRQMDPDEFNPEDLDSEADISNTSEDGPNDHVGYETGGIVYGVWDPPGAPAPTHYNLVGIGTSGMAIRDYDADDNAVIFLLHN